MGGPAPACNRNQVHGPGSMGQWPGRKGIKP